MIDQDSKSGRKNMPDQMEQINIVEKDVAITTTKANTTTIRLTITHQLVILRLV